MAPCSLLIRSQQFGTSDAARGPSTSSFDHLVGAGEQRRRDFEPECLCSLEVDRQFELGWLQHWKIGWLLAPENAAGMRSGQLIQFIPIGCITYQLPGHGGHGSEAVVGDRG